MALTPKFFCVATEGATTDGREITRSDIEQMAASYDFSTRAARINIEHIKGVAPSGEFGSYGDVLALKTGNVTVKLDGKDVSRLGLFAQIKPLDNLKALTDAGQKLYSSIEINPNFAGTGKAYLMGVAVTDNPAALGTEVLKFCAGHPAASPFVARKSDPSCLFTAAYPAELDFTEAPASEDDATGMLAMFAKVFSSLGVKAPSPAEAPAAPAAQPAAPAGADASTVAMFAALATKMDAMAAQNASLVQRVTASEAANTALRAQLDAEPSRNFTQRPTSTGTNNATATDC